MGAASPIYMLRSLKSTKYIIYKRGIWERKAIGPTRSVEGMNDGSLFYQIGLKWQQPNILLGREYWESLGVLALFGLCLYQEETAIDVWDRQYSCNTIHLITIWFLYYSQSMVSHWSIWQSADLSHGRNRRVFSYSTLIDDVYDRFWCSQHVDWGRYAYRDIRSVFFQILNNHLVSVIPLYLTKFTNRWAREC